MGFDFTSSALRKLTSEEQMAKYRQLAAQAEKIGEHANREAVAATSRRVVKLRD